MAGQRQTEQPHGPKTFMLHALAGAAAGMAETATMFPVDTIKTRLQVIVYAAAAMSLGNLGLCPFGH